MDIIINGLEGSLGTIIVFLSGYIGLYFTSNESNRSIFNNIRENSKIYIEFIVFYKR